ncbi:MAG: hypothetical protein N4A45_11690 [Flavobacteriales bacterium]|jgi:hypothetical protein|nr:hypothetical protein [Flavobacteriales bacterium]
MRLFVLIFLVYFNLGCKSEKRGSYELLAEYIAKNEFCIDFYGGARECISFTQEPMYIPIDFSINKTDSSILLREIFNNNFGGQNLSIQSSLELIEFLNSRIKLYKMLSRHSVKVVKTASEATREIRLSPVFYRNRNKFVFMTVTRQEFAEKWFILFKFSENGINTHDMCLS